MRRRAWNARQQRWETTASLAVGIACTDARPAGEGISRHEGCHRLVSPATAAVASLHVALLIYHNFLSPRESRPQTQELAAMSSNELTPLA